MKLQKRHLRTAPLIAAYKSLSNLFTLEAINTTATIDFKARSVFDFHIDGIGHGIAEVLSEDDTITGIQIKQFTSESQDIIFSEFYESRHGNKELLCLLHPLIESILLPALAKSL